MKKQNMFVSSFLTVCNIDELPLQLNGKCDMWNERRVQATKRWHKCELLIKKCEYTSRSSFSLQYQFIVIYYN